MKACRRKYIEWGAAGIGALALFLFFFRILPYHLFHREQTQLFLLATEPLAGYLRHPAALSISEGHHFVECPLPNRQSRPSHVWFPAPSPPAVPGCRYAADGADATPSSPPLVRKKKKRHWLSLQNPPAPAHSPSARGISIPRRISPTATFLQSHNSVRNFHNLPKEGN